jgi:hypothetical protein
MNKLTQTANNRAMLHCARVQRENDLIAWGCGIVLSALVIAFLL